MCVTDATFPEFKDAIRAFLDESQVSIGDIGRVRLKEFLNRTHPPQNLLCVKRYDPYLDESAIMGFVEFVRTKTGLCVAYALQMSDFGDGISVIEECFRWLVNNQYVSHADEIEIESNPRLISRELRDELLRCKRSLYPRYLCVLL